MLGNHHRIHWVVEVPVHLHHLQGLHDFSEEDVVELGCAPIHHGPPVLEGDGELHLGVVNGMHRLQLGLVLWEPGRQAQHNPIKRLCWTKELPEIHKHCC